MLRANVNPLEIIEQLQSVSCDVSKEARKKDKTIGKSCADSIATQMIKFINGELRPNTKTLINLSPTVKLLEQQKPQEKDGKFQCPECKEYTLTKYDGCIQCTNCTYQKCH